jgi:antitoxin (DNA-binding transcriptional repressor) of toxin-antitoxin stability system
VNYKEQTILTSHDGECAKLIPAERHYCKTNQSLLFKSRNFKMKRILATRTRKHNNIETCRLSQLRTFILHA